MLPIDGCGMCMRICSRVSVCILYVWRCMYSGAILTIRGLHRHIIFLFFFIRGVESSQHRIDEVTLSSAIVWVHCMLTHTHTRNSTARPPLKSCTSCDWSIIILTAIGRNKKNMISSIYPRLLSWRWNDINLWKRFVEIVHSSNQLAGATWNSRNISKAHSAPCTACKHIFNRTINFRRKYENQIEIKMKIRKKEK